MWTRGLAGWYAGNGRHHLPWRATRDPWPVLVSEVMLQQTQVARVQPKWEAFMERWPTAEACAAASLDDVLRAWQGLGYPRRALALHGCAIAVARDGWPDDEAGLRALPGVGRYTARALLALAFEVSCPPPLDVNIARVAARAALGSEPQSASQRQIEDAVAAGQPRSMRRRDYVLALFDAGAIHCRSVPRCAGCPLAGGCRSRRRLAASPSPAPSARRQPPYAGSFRQLRGAVLAAMIDSPRPPTPQALVGRMKGLSPAPSAAAVVRAVESLAADGLVTASRVPRSDG
jgi:A/G-specific adenine glycosylase